MNFQYWEDFERKKIVGGGVLKTVNLDKKENLC